MPLVLEGGVDVWAWAWWAAPGYEEPNGFSGVAVGIGKHRIAETNPLANSPNQANPSLGSGSGTNGSKQQTGHPTMPAGWVPTHLQQIQHAQVQMRLL